LHGERRGGLAHAEDRDHHREDHEGHPDPEDAEPRPSKTNALVSPANASRTVLRRTRRGRSSAWIDDEALS
jgi:hypothetical protein